MAVDSRVAAAPSALARQLADLQVARAALQHEVAHDALTGLPNRLKLTRCAASHKDKALTVLLLDLNGFKPVNDTYGHRVGDEVLRVVGERLTACLRAGDMAGRLGGDEFLVVLPQTGADAADRLAARIREAIATPMTVQGHTLRVGASIGAGDARPAPSSTRPRSPPRPTPPCTRQKSRSPHGPDRWIADSMSLAMITTSSSASSARRPGGLPDRRRGQPAGS